MTWVLNAEGEIIIYKPQEDTRIQVMLLDDTVFGWRWCFWGCTVYQYVTAYHRRSEHYC